MNNPPAIGQLWRGGIYAGISRGEDGQPDGHLVLLDAMPDKDLKWADAVKWAADLGNGARLPTRFESALLYTNVRDNIELGAWYWTGTQYSAYGAWGQDFDYGGQYGYDKKFEARCRAVRRFDVGISDET